MVCDGEIAHIVGKYADDPEDAAARLIQQANENGGRDNVSVILIRIAHEYPASRGLLARLLAWFR